MSTSGHCPATAAMPMPASLDRTRPGSRLVALQHTRPACARTSRSAYSSAPQHPPAHRLRRKGVRLCRREGQTART
eukprot:4145049-Alexandrium_andersonii.AAC.1